MGKERYKIKKIFESELFIINKNDEVIVIKDKRKAKRSVFNLEHKNLLYEIAKCVELSREFTLFDSELEQTLLKEDLELIDTGRYYLKNSSSKEWLQRTFSYHLMP